MSTNPQSPQGSPSEARGSQSPSHPVAEGRQSPGPSEPLRLGKIGDTSRALPAGLSLAAPGAPQTLEHSEDPLGMAKSLHDAGVMERKPAEPLHEEGTAGVDLADLLDEAARNLSKDIPCNPDGSCIRCRTFRAAARLRAQAPASILDPKSPGIPASTADTVLHFGAPASSPRDLEALVEEQRRFNRDNVLCPYCCKTIPKWKLGWPAHPPKGETPSEAAPLLCRHCGKKPAACIGRYEGHGGYHPACDDCCAHGNEDGFCTAPQNFAELMKDINETISGLEDDLDAERDLKRPAPGTPIEASAREGLHQIMRDAATITQRLTGDVIVLADRIHDIARASLSSLPQAQEEPSGAPAPTVQCLYCGKISDLGRGAVVYEPQPPAPASPAGREDAGERCPYRNPDCPQCYPKPEAGAPGTQTQEGGAHG